jgi:hypothetical protein
MKLKMWVEMTGKRKWIKLFKRKQFSEIGGLRMVIV